MPRRDLLVDDQRPMAEPWRVEQALRMFPQHEQSAEEYAARWSHTIGCSSFDEYRYPDSALTAWIDELHRLLRSASELERCRRAHLSPAEYNVVQAEIAYAKRHGLKRAELVAQGLRVVIGEAK